MTLSLISCFDPAVADRFLPASCLSALDCGYRPVLQVGPKVRVPRFVAERCTVLRSRLWSYGTTNYTVPRLILLPDLCRENASVVLQDVDCILVEPLRPGGTLLSRWGSRPEGWEPEADLIAAALRDGAPPRWYVEGRRILAAIARFSGPAGLRLARAVRAEALAMSIEDRDRWYADQVALWRGLMRAGDAGIEWLDEVEYGLRAGAGPIRHPHPPDKDVGGAWDGMTATYRARWFAP